VKDASLTFAALAGLLPALFWLWYIISRDRYEREPRRLIWRALAAGGLATIPAVLLESVVGADALLKGDALAIGVGAFFLVGPIEELCKFLAVYKTVYREPDFNEPLDGVIYAATASLGFSAVENIFYILSFGADIALLRAILATPLHFTVGAIWGAALGRAKFAARGQIGLILGGLVVASAFHGGYDFLLSLDSAGATLLAIVVLVPCLWVIWHRTLRTLLAASPFRAIPCPRCGISNPAQARFCVACRHAIAGAVAACPSCQREILAGAAFCVGCGARL
jgi:RsiW-degrading membrane proteinase PrsW (M82 family)